MWVNRIASKRCISLSSNLVWILQVAVGRTLLILVKVGLIIFFNRSTRKHSYTLRAKKYCTVWICIQLSSELVCILQNAVRRTSDYGELGIMVIFTEVEKRILIHYGLQGQIIKTILVSKWFVRFCSNLMCNIIGHIPTYCVIFGEFRIYCSFKENNK